MADRIDMLAAAISWPAAARSSAFALLFLAVAALAPSPSSAEPYVYVARASLMGVERSFVSQGTASISGAGVRAFEDPEIENSGTERFEIRWYANPPGIPPGVIVLLESLQERNPVVKNHILRLNGKSEGHICSVIEIPPDEVRQAGRVLKWRVRVVWRGKLLASQASANWEG
jgi:hypothetical protein